METPRRDRVRGNLLAKMPKGGVAAEIGVWEGNFSERIIALTQPKELHLIDPWLYQPEFSNTGFGRKKNEARMDEMYAEVAAKFEGIKGVKVHRAKSEDALASFPDNYFDWVYIDGNHNEPFVGQDLALARAKVKSGGVIAGDDYNWNADAGAPVKTAVDKLVAELGDEAGFEKMGNQYLIRLP
jgi:hypothetical protein